MMRRSIDVVNLDLGEIPDGLEDVTPLSWTIAVSDDYDDAEPRVQLTVERIGEAGEGLVAHLSPNNARRLRRAIADALREVGEPTE